MPERRVPALSRAMIGALAPVACMMMALTLPSPIRDIITERSFDMITSMSARLHPLPPPPVPIIVVDVDQRTLDNIGTRQWTRMDLAELVATLRARKPAVVAIDMLLSQPDTQSPASLARRLAAETGQPDLAALAATLPDADLRLASALASVPSVLGYVLDPANAGQIPSAPFLVQDHAALPQHWRGAGAIGPASQLLKSSQGIGMLGIPGDADGIVRRVPLFVSAGQTLYPGFSLEILRIWQDASAYLISGQPPTVQVGDLIRRIPDSAMLRIMPVTQPQGGIVTVSATDVMTGNAAASSVSAGAFVLVGSSAPQLGGLRPVSGDALVPSVMIQARALHQMWADRIPMQPSHHVLIAAASVASAMGLALMASLTMGTLGGLLTIAAALAALAVTALGLSIKTNALFDPVIPGLAAILVFSVASLVNLSEARARATRIRQRFEQHLAPQVVAMIVANPELLKVRGERRRIAALFTDIESFTSMTERNEPEQIVRVLDRYFEGVSDIVVAHGGMVDKFVGDAVHALFNAPLDQANFCGQAVACAVAIRDWTEDYRASGLPAAMGLGRTRTGVETGDAIVGDVGISSKLDYTAYGEVMNLASRLEAANKVFGSAICLGPAIAAQVPQALLRPLGEISLAGLKLPVQTFEPWPANATEDWKQSYVSALRKAEIDPETGIEAFIDVATGNPADVVSRNFAEGNLPLQAPTKSARIGAKVSTSSPASSATAE